MYDYRIEKAEGKIVKSIKIIDDHVVLITFTDKETLSIAADLSYDTYGNTTLDGYEMEWNEDTTEYEEWERNFKEWYS